MKKNLRFRIREKHVMNSLIDTERYIVKATPMTTSSSSNHNVKAMPPVISQNLEENKTEETGKRPLESDADPKVEEDLERKEGTDSPQVN